MITGPQKYIDESSSDSKNTKKKKQNNKCSISCTSSQKTIRDVFFPLTTEIQVILLKVLTAYRKVEILEYIASCKSSQLSQFSEVLTARFPAKVVGISVIQGKLFHITKIH